MNVGDIGEKLLSKFIDSNFSKTYSFADPKTKTNAQVTDVLVWLNRFALLLEVKTRDTSKGITSTENWARNQVQDGVEQLLNGYSKIIAKEQIFIHNDYFQTQLDCGQGGRPCKYAFHILLKCAM